MQKTARPKSASRSLPCAFITARFIDIVIVKVNVNNTKTNVCTSEKRTRFIAKLGQVGAPLPTLLNLQDLHLPDNFRKMTTGNDFLLDGSGSSQHRTLIFSMRHKNLEIMSHCLTGIVMELSRQCLHYSLIYIPSMRGNSITSSRLASF